MNRKTILITLAVLLALVIVWLVADQSEVIDQDQSGGQATEPEEVLAQVPFEETIGSRTITFDQESVEQLPREDYSQGEILAEMDMDVHPDEDPLEYVVRHLTRNLESEFMAEQEDGMFQYSVSVYPLEDEEGVSIFIRALNIPDDSIGGGEDRYDFVLTDGQWDLNWFGSRVFCQRMDNEFWQPAEELCP